MWLDIVTGWSHKRVMANNVIYGAFSSLLTEGKVFGQVCGRLKHKLMTYSVFRFVLISQ